MGQQCVKPQDTLVRNEGGLRQQRAPKTKEAYDNCPYYRYQPQGEEEDANDSSRLGLSKLGQSVVSYTGSASPSPARFAALHQPFPIPVPETVEENKYIPVPETVEENKYDIWVHSARQKFGSTTPRGHRVKELGEKIFNADDGVVHIVTRKKGDRVLESKQRTSQSQDHDDVAQSVSPSPRGSMNHATPHKTGGANVSSSLPPIPTGEVSPVSSRSAARSSHGNNNEEAVEAEAASSRSTTVPTVADADDVPSTAAEEKRKPLNLLQLARLQAAQSSF